MQVISTQKAVFTKAKNVQIPEIYSRRFTTGKEDLDFLFGGQGFLPGMTFTLAASPGAGKSSILLQTLEAVSKIGKKVAFVSGEEPVEQLAFTCKRLGVDDVLVANITDIDDICAAIASEKFDFLILDSLPAITVKRDMQLNGREKEEYIVNRIVTTAKKHECIIGTIMHFTKGGTYKGSTLLPHSVDMNMIMRRNEEDETLRDIEVTKNRFGAAVSVSFRMNPYGFDFEDVSSEESGSSSKKDKGPSQKDRVLESIKTKKTIAEIHKETGISIAYLQTILRELDMLEQIVKDGRGKDAVYMKKD
jgi:DNA repair protein RadA/Sms